MVTLTLILTLTLTHYPNPPGFPFFPPETFFTLILLSLIRTPTRIIICCQVWQWRLSSLHLHLPNHWLVFIRLVVEEEYMYVSPQVIAVLVLKEVGVFLPRRPLMILGKGHRLAFLSCSPVTGLPLIYLPRHVSPLEPRKCLA